MGFLTAIAVDAANDNMPPQAYRWMHRESVLSVKDRALLTAWSSRERLALRQTISKPSAKVAAAKPVPSY